MTIRPRVQILVALLLHLLGANPGVSSTPATSSAATGPATVERQSRVHASQPLTDRDALRIGEG